MRRKIGFVVPRYGEHILGGAESLVRSFAERLAARGHPVSVLATCIRSYHTWANEDPPGRSHVNAVVVDRFPVLTGWATERAVDLWRRAGALSVAEQYEWVGRLPQSPGLYRAIQKRQEEFDVIFFAPYLYSTTYLGAVCALEKAVLWPCLHDEEFAYFHPTRVLLSRAAGVAYNTDSERALAHRLGARNPRERVIGAGVELDWPIDALPPAPIAAPYIMYAGRLEAAKNYGLLSEYFIRYKTRHANDLKLVVSGTGLLEGIQHPDIVKLGFAPREQMLAAMRSALLLCQPSTNESFSYVIMEAWLAGAPVLVHRRCAVTFEHVTKSGGGLAFAGYGEFEAAVEQVLHQPSARARMATLGGQYVKDVYNWDAVLARLEDALAHWCPQDPSLL